jgi:hypothetical protein
MTDIPSDHGNRSGTGGDAPVATEERVGRSVLDTAGDGTSVAVHEVVTDLAANGASNATDNGTANGNGRATDVSDLAAGRPRHAVGQGHATWRQVLLAGLVCFALWLVLDAPTLLRSAQEAPLGTRRSVAISLLRPVARVSDALGLSHVVGGADRVIGHAGSTGTGVLQVEGVPAHRHRAAPPPAAVPPVSGPVPSAVIPVTAPDGLAPLGVPTPAAPLRLLVVGDSLGIDFGQPLVNDLAASDVVSAVLDGHIDTGLARPDYFDWQAELQRDLTRYLPQAVVVLVGANDPQSFDDGPTALNYGTAAWNAAYAKRVGAFMAQATASGARMLWIGLPPMADPVLNAKMQVLNDIVQSQAPLHRGVTYFASWPVLADPQGHYTPFIPNASGNEVQIREPDGTHIAAPGAQLLSQAAIAFMGHEWGLVL